MGLTGSEVKYIIIKAGSMAASRQAWCWRKSRKSTSCSKGNLKTGLQASRRRVSKSTPTVTHFLQQGQTYSNKVIPPNSASPWAKHFQTTTSSKDMPHLWKVPTPYSCGINLQIHQELNHWWNQSPCYPAITQKPISCQPTLNSRAFSRMLCIQTTTPGKRKRIQTQSEKQ